MTKSFNPTIENSKGNRYWKKVRMYGKFLFGLDLINNLNLAGLWYG